MKTYKLYLAKPLLIFYVVLFAAFPIAGVIGIIVSAVGAFGPDGPPWWVFTILLVFGLLQTYFWLRFPFEIRLDDNTAEFRSIFRKAIVPIGEIKAIRARRFALGLVDVVHQRGKVPLLSQMDAFHDFILTIKSSNPGVQIKGC